MKRTLLILFCALMSVQIFSTVDISPELFPTLAGLQRTACLKNINENEVGTVWGSRSYLMQEIQTTTIDGKQYIVFGDEYDRFALREENNKILVYSSILKKDLVLYDFTLEVGDSLPALYFEERAHNAMQQWLYNGDIVDYNKDDDGTILPAETFVVTDISTITLLDGKEYKKWTFDNGMEYVEGIGSFGTSYAWNDFYQLIANGPLYSDVFSQHLVCASKNGQLLYKMDDAEMEQLETECLCDGYQSSYKDQWSDTWNVLSHGYRPGQPLFGACTMIYQLEGDTTINQQVYTKLVCTYTNYSATEKWYSGALRFTEDKKVYIYYDNTEYLLYDFDVQIGDTLDVFAGIDYYDFHKTYPHVVTNVNKLDDGRLQFYLDAIVRDEYLNQEEKFPKTWIEGVGSVDGIIHNNAIIGVGGNGKTALLCAYHNDECIYTTDNPYYTSLGCVYNDPIFSATEEVNAPAQSAQKIMYNGQLLILRDGKTYNVMGMEVTK